MINTVNTKREQLKNGFFKTGSGKELILIVGSCRSVPYCNYFAKWNEMFYNRFTIAFVDPFNFNYDLNDDRVDAEQVINSYETNENMLALLRSTTIFLHEHYSNYGLFNCDKSAEKNIYQFGLSARIDICIPNFNNFFILAGDIVSFDLEVRKKAIADYNVIGKLSAQTEKEIFEISQKNLQKFYDVCLKSDLPEMKDVFEKNFRDRRFFHTHNHVSKHFTQNVFSLINEKYLKLDLPDAFWWAILNDDMFASNFTPITVYDLEWYQYQWGEGIVPLKDKL